MNPIPSLVLSLLAACLSGCAAFVGPERAIAPDAYTDSDLPANVLKWTAGDDLTLSGSGDPTAYTVDADGAMIATEGIGTGLGISPHGSIYLWSPSDVTIDSMSFTVDEGGRLIPTKLSGLSSKSSDVRLARNEMAKATAHQITALAETERAAAVESFRLLADAGSEFAADVLASLLTGGAR